SCDENLTWVMNNQHHLTFGLLLGARNVDTEVEKRLRMLETCQLPEFREIRKEASQTTFLTVLANSGAWFIYIIPILVVVVCYQRLKEFVRTLLGTPGRTLDQLAQGCEA